MALVGIGVFACLPLGLGYLTYGHDLSIHLSRIEGLKAGLLAGQFPVRMDPAIINEKGYPFSLMYSDVFLCPAAVLRILGFSLQTSYKVYVVSITAATVGITFYALRKMFRSDCAALLGTALYTLSFYRLTNVFVRAAVGEYTRPWRSCRWSCTGCGGFIANPLPMAKRPSPGAGCPLPWALPACCRAIC